jgi:hypothetical protein
LIFLLQLVAPDPDADYIQAPFERLGNTYELNWQLNKHQVTPFNDAYRNLHLRALVQRTKGKLGT